MCIASTSQFVLNESVLFQHDFNPVLSRDVRAAFSHLGEDGAVGLVVGFALQDKAARPSGPGVNAGGVLAIRCFHDPIVPNVG